MKGISMRGKSSTKREDRFIFLFFNQEITFYSIFKEILTFTQRITNFTQDLNLIGSVVSISLLGLKFICFYRDIFPFEIFI